MHTVINEHVAIDRASRTQQPALKVAIEAAIPACSYNERNGQVLHNQFPL